GEARRRPRPPSSSLISDSLRPCSVNVRVISSRRRRALSRAKRSVVAPGRWLPMSSKGTLSRPARSVTVNARCSKRSSDSRSAQCRSSTPKTIGRCCASLTITCPIASRSCKRSWSAGTVNEERLDEDAVSARRSTWLMKSKSEPTLGQQRFDERQIGQREIFIAAAEADVHPQAGGDRLDLVDQTRLANARVTLDQHHAGLAGGHFPE